MNAVSQRSSKVVVCHSLYVCWVKALPVFWFCLVRAPGRGENVLQEPLGAAPGSGMHPPIQHTALDRATVPAIQHTALDRAGRPDSCHQCGAGTYGILTNAIASAPRKMWCRDIWDFDKCYSWRATKTARPATQHNIF